MTNERIKEIQKIIDDLGDLSTWQAVIDVSYSDMHRLAVAIPGQFLLSMTHKDGDIGLAWKYEATPDDYALWKFLGEAPRLVKELLEEIKRLQGIQGGSL